MKFLKGLASFIGSLLVIAVILGVFWLQLGDPMRNQILSLFDQIDGAEEDAQIAEETKDMREILDQAYTYITNQNIIECLTYESYTDETANTGDRFNCRTAWDRETMLAREVTFASNPAQPEDVGSRRIFIQANYDPNDYLSDCWEWFDYQLPQPVNYCGDTYNDIRTFTAQPDTWYHYHSLDTFHEERSFGFSIYMPHALPAQMIVTGYEVLGPEDCGGETAVHYIVTHKPIFNYSWKTLDAYYSLDDGTWCAPREYFETIIDQRIKDDFPEFYKAFMDEVEKEYYQDNQTHLWITEEGKLLKAQWDYTFESNEGIMIVDDCATIYTYLDPGSPAYRPDFAQLVPKTWTAVFTYGEDVEPITIPEECISLTE